MHVESKQIITAGDMSQSSLTSDETNLNQMAIACIIASYTGSPTGSLQLQVTNDVVAPKTWTNYLTPLSISAAGSNIWEINYVGFMGLRAVYTKSGGTGNLTISVGGKG